MLGYYKGRPTEYVMKFVDGKVVKQGPGISFLYLRLRTSLISVPLNTMDFEFVFNEITANFQEVTVQGQVTCRVSDPAKAASILDFSIDPKTRARLSRDPEKLSVRLVNLVQEATRCEIQKSDFEDILRKGADLASAVLERVKEKPEVSEMGLKVLNLYINSVKPTPEVGKALEADYRETLLKRADQAIYDRRAYAVEQERKIQENQLETDISLEKERERLVDLKAANLGKEAEAEGKALEVRMAPYAKMDARILTALGIKLIGEKVQGINTLNITPDLLTELLKGRA